MEELLAKQIWLLLRQELSLADFEQWVYANTEIKDVIGWKNHLELISADFTDRNFILNCFEEWFQQKYPNTISLKLRAEIADSALTFILGPQNPQHTLACCRRFLILGNYFINFFDDDDLMAFYIVDDEADYFMPMNKDRNLYCKLYLAKEDNDIKRWQERAELDLLDASNNLLKRFAHPPDS